MSYFVVCTFDLANASSDDSQDAYADLKQIGLHGQVRSSQGNDITLPTTTTAGEFDGQSAGSVRDDVIGRVKNAFAARGFQSEIFVSVAGNWAWGHRTT